MTAAIAESGVRRLLARECVGPARGLLGRAGEIGGQPLEGVTVVAYETTGPREFPVVYPNTRALMFAIH